MTYPSILIFNQEEAIRDSLSLVLREEGYRCRSGDKEAWMQQLLINQSIGLVILDTHSKILFKLLKMVRQLNPAANVLLISSYAENEVAEKALILGADDLVLKPLDFDELIRKVKELLPVDG